MGPVSRRSCSSCSRRVRRRATHPRSRLRRLMRPDVVGVVVTVGVVIVVCAGLGVRVVVLVAVVDVDGVHHVLDLAGRWAGRWTKWWRRWPGLKWRTVGVNLWLRRNYLRLRWCCTKWWWWAQLGRWTKWCCTKCWLRWWAHLRLWRVVRWCSIRP